MFYHNKLFLAVVLVLAGALTSPSWAVPTVKKLGMSSSGNIQNNKLTPSKPSASAAKISTTSDQRTPSVRLGVSYAKPTVKTVGNTKISSAKTVSGANTKAANVADAERLSVIRKHLINGNVGTSSGVTPQSQSVETDNMLKRIVALEEQMLNKQEILEAGDGIVIDNKTIAVSEELGDLPEKVSEIDQKISGLDNKVDVANLAENYYDKGYIQDNYYTKQYVDQIVSQLSGANVVDHFDPGFLHQ